ncbi:beta-lactamase [Hirsutella rhossiliensis]|uniref:Beta-lactamase domain-containing protein n=1 Tax=Hirsutella rhossiliensis TaxID=111463 RepID=A0A9P8N8Z0_9HYPO|nr:beta-lactamase domain-containing protein [Hirsutella rhossiliensis]KAH0968186.1 beta-lactamase domain-containing protein [Hirsutella rhossiliensis]
MDLLQSPIFTAHVEALMQAQHVPGLAIAILENNTVASTGYGWASIDPPKPCTADTLFDIASASKSLTAASVGLLVRDNVHYPEVQYKATMSSLLPGDFVMSEEEYTKSVTVEDVLSHRTGIAGHDLSYLGPGAAQPDNARSITRNLRNLGIASPLRSKYLYCNMMYTVASYLVEKATGLPFADFLELRFFQPLNMQSTNLQPGRARDKGLGDRIATGYLWDEKSKQYQGLQAQDEPEAQGAGLVISSVNDYIKWVKAMVNHEDPITRDVYKGLVKPRTIEDPGDTHLRPLTSPMLYGAGWETYYYRGHAIISHDGSDPGFQTSHFFLPEFKSGGAIFDNSDSGDVIINILMREIIDEFLKVPEAERVDWKKIETEPRSAGHEQEEETTAELLPKHCPGSKKPHPQMLPLAAYTGRYWNRGYHSLTVQISNDSLFVDAEDRSFPFMLTFQHLCNQTKYIAHMQPTDFQGIEDAEDIDAEFRLHNDTAIKMGLDLESDLPDLIWFDKV